jgi:hypothetical protein
MNSTQSSSVPTISTRVTYSDAVQSEIADAGEAETQPAQSPAKPALIPQNPAQIAASSLTPEATTQSQMQRVQKSTSAAAPQAQRILQPDPAMLSAAIATKAAVPAAPGKQTTSERTSPQKQSETRNGDSRTASQTIFSPSQTVAPAPLPVSSPTPNANYANTAGAVPISPASDRTGPTTETSPGKTLSMAAAANAESTGSPSVTEAHTEHSPEIDAENTTQSAPERVTSPPPSPATDLALKTSSAQPDPGYVSNTLQPAASIAQPVADAPQAHPPTNHGPAQRDLGSLEHKTSGVLVQQPGPQSGPVVSQSTLVRDPSGTSGIPGERNSAAPQLEQASIQPSRNPFSALDADPGQPDLQWTHRSARQVEAGFQDPSLGWVSVRADLTPGGLHASVVPNSPEASQMLGSHIFGLNAYLAERHGGSVTVSLAGSENHSSTLSLTPGQQGQSGEQQQNESNQPAITQTALSSAISTGNTQAVESATLAPTHDGLISVIA